MTTNQTGGGFIGDLAEALAPPAAGDCCGSTAAAQQDAQAGCCGQAPAPATTPAAEAASTGCCG
ncbi:hypothetical protein [Nonomuraea sp. NPDC052265]|uniref:hypothetical protein n=1 Tax=Nonomuraea sp. NPDC052265 TaxID=3364374 RepID=UPI0037C8F7FC